MTSRGKTTPASTSGSFASHVRNAAEATVETNFQRLQREAGITDPADPSFNSDLDVVLAGLPLTYREVISIGGVEPHDEDALDELREAYAAIQTVPPRPVEDVRRELLDVLRSRSR